MEFNQDRTRAAERDTLEKRMRARLVSFQSAYEKTLVNPSPDDFNEIWGAVESVYQTGLRTISGKMETNQSARAQSLLARPHNKVFGELRVWRSGVPLASVAASFSDDRIKDVDEFPRKDVLVADLSHLLTTETLSVAVVFIDLDNFKAVNDTIGHEAGDKCIEKAARIIASAALHKGRVYRYASGDEFVVVLPNSDKAEAGATAERIRQAIDAENPGNSVKVTASIGVTIASKATHDSADQILQSADTAMYAAKNMKNKVVFG